MTKKSTATKSSNLFLNVLVLAALVVILAVSFFPQTVKSILANQLTKITGLPVTIRQLDFSLSQPQFLLKDLLLKNPAGFPGAELATISKVRVEYAPSFAMLGKFNLKKVEVDFNELRLIRNEAGTINLPALPSTQAVGEAIIEELVVDLQNLTYTDLSGKEPVQKSFEVGLDKAIYRNVKGVAGILEIVNWEVLKRTGIEAKTEPAAAPPHPEAKPTPEPAAVKEEDASITPETSEPTRAPSEEKSQPAHSPA